MHRRAFTIIELLVVIGITALLMGILLPTMWVARGMAMKVVCAARLRDLTTAATLYYGDSKQVYPAPMRKLTSVPYATPVTFRPAPERISNDLLNELRPYLNFPEIAATMPVASLPPFLQCPFVELETASRGPFPSEVATSATYYTGYSYLGRISEVSVPDSSVSHPSSGLLAPLPTLTLTLLNGLTAQLEPGIEIKIGRAASARSPKRAVIWSDTVSQTDSSGHTWLYSHAKHSKGGTYTTPIELLGQHRAFTDGSVEWVRAGAPGLEVSESATINQTKASFKTLVGELWWF